MRRRMDFGSWEKKKYGCQRNHSFINGISPLIIKLLKVSFLYEKKIAKLKHFRENVI